ncbi:hypothetical protein CWI38_0160p0020 [Hamiltosporidium tvaerminnensis]|uniref:Uncharacterized protein n=2 Tax=Hamiltosporidium TaxID=1176354 RepID=A0A4Q9L5D7_9MICR|nr:hypothetical protein CWI37_0864p0030 [Hamiltosporidium tvaerminnensis]TBU02793.1 hypothetical protein CWI39_1087p0010 [Hamiltosporidium magnivora]TBU06808.1 hypothetical protein CWI36_0377p0020 [Hamiltosporidium magnivora]TBU19976.1 hypothetical protein CWI38_0160p0020 [Hamiltosporidium tvaerminnensis]
MNSNINSTLETEYKILSKVIYKSKNRHKNTFLFRKLNNLKRFIKKFKETPNTKDKYIIQVLSQDIYLLGSSNIEIGHFISLSLVCMGLAARFKYLVETFDFSKINTTEIDSIFENIFDF